MKFELGDQVVVKHSNEDGKVIEILSDKMVMVEVRGVKFPAYTDQLDFPYFKMFSSKPVVESKKPAKKFIDEIPKEKPAPKYQVLPGVWLLIFPVYDKDVFEDEVVEELKIFLVNQTNQGLKFHFWLDYAGRNEMELQNTVYASADFYLLNIPFEDLNDQPEMAFEFSLITPDKKKLDYYEANYKLKPKQMFKLMEELKQNGQSFVPVRLFEAYPDKPVVSDMDFSVEPLGKLSSMGFTVKRDKNSHFKENPPPSVLDLHIEKLTDAHVSMTSHEKLMLQIREFEKWLEKSAMHYMKHLWVIHGVGSGRLKEELHEILKRRSDVKSFANHFHPWFGHGATEIFFN